MTSDANISRNLKNNDCGQMEPKINAYEVFRLRTSVLVSSSATSIASFLFRSVKNKPGHPYDGGSKLKLLGKAKLDDLPHTSLRNFCLAWWSLAILLSILGIGAGKIGRMDGGVRNEDFVQVNSKILYTLHELSTPFSPLFLVTSRRSLTHVAVV